MFEAQYLLSTQSPDISLRVDIVFGLKQIAYQLVTQSNKTQTNTLASQDKTMHI